MTDFGFSLPTEIRFGSGVLEELSGRIKAGGYRKPLVVTDKSMMATGLVDKVVNQLEKAAVEVEIFDDTVPNPRDHDCDKGAQYAKQVGADVLIAVGGGSSMDTAKAMATVMTNGKTTREWFDVDLDVESVPVICIPTTCGTGSEVTYNAVITNSDTHLKGNIFDPKCAPVLALVDPDMIKDLPSSLVASTGVDALTHAVEAYVCTLATPMTDAVAICAIEILSKNLIKAANERDEEALSQVMLASMMAGVAFGNSDTASVHSIAECFGGYYDIPHGVTNAMFLADVSEFSVPGNIEKYAGVARALGVSQGELTSEGLAYEGVKRIREICEELKIPKLSEFKNIDPKDFEYLAEASEKHCCNPHNPIEINKEEYLEIFKKVYER